MEKKKQTMNKIVFTVNGKVRELSTAPDDLLVDVLRDQLGLTGAKKGCAKGDCGACTVIMNGKPVNACLIASAKAQGSSIVTIEGIGTDDSLHPLQESFINHGAVQCGYCSPGMILSAKALLDRNPHPSPEEIKEGISGNLCRCTGYKKIIEAVQSASLGNRETKRAQGHAVQKPSPNVVGTRQVNIRAKDKVLGKSIFGADLSAKEMLHMKILASPHAHALIHGIDTSEAEKIPGVVGVITEKDIPGENMVRLIRSMADQPVLARGKVRYQGEPVAAVAALTPEIAQAALDSIRVEYEPLKTVRNASEALAPEAPKIHPEGNLIKATCLAKGDVNQGFCEADAVVEDSFHTPFVEHAYLETEGGFASFDQEGRLVIKSCCQDTHLIQRNLSKILDMREEEIRVILAMTGGGFGGKLDVAYQSILGVMAAKIRRPVKLVLEREESFQGTPKRHAYDMKVRLGAKKDGTFTAVSYEVLSDGGAYSCWSQSVLLKSAVHTAGPYYIPNVSFEGKVVYTNNPYCGAMRGFGVPQNAFALESIIDILCEKLGLDPLEVRLRNALDQGQTTSTGQVLEHSVGIKKTLEALRATYQNELERLRNQHPGNLIKEGLGLGCMIYGVGFTALSNPSEADVELLENGRFRLYIGSCDIGQGSDTTMGQIAAEELRMPIELFEIIASDTDMTPDGRMTCASRQTYVSGKAVQIAAQCLRQELEEAAAKVLEVPQKKIRVQNGAFFYSEMNRERKVTLVQLYEICRQMGKTLKHHGYFDPEITPLDEKGQGNPYGTYAFATQMAKVAVDRETGEVRVKNIWAAHDAGKAINLMAAEGQIEGGAVMGTGYALMEEFISGVTSNFKQYAIPTVHDMPDLNTYVIEEEEPSGPFGAKGIGEPAMVPTAPAIANAVYHAVGARVKDLPILPEKVLKLLN